MTHLKAAVSKWTSIELNQIRGYLNVLGHSIASEILIQNLIEGFESSPEALSRHIGSSVNHVID